MVALLSRPTITEALEWDECMYNAVMERIARVRISENERAKKMEAEWKSKLRVNQ